MTVARLMPALALGMLPLLAQTSTNPVNVDQVITLQANLSTLNENPPIATSSSAGTATVTIRFTGANSATTNPITGQPVAITGTTSSVSKATVSVNIQANTDVADSITLAHIHRGAAGVNGPVVIDFSLTNTPISAGGSVSINKQFDVTDAAQLAILREIVNNPSGFYVNAHTSTNPSGFFRGQLRRSGGTAADSASMQQDLVTRLVVRIAYQQGIITSAERDAYLATLPAPAPVSGAGQ